MNKPFSKPGPSRPILTLKGLKPSPSPAPNLAPEPKPPTPEIARKPAPRPAPPRVQLIETDPAAAAAFGPLLPLPERSPFRSPPKRLKFASYPEIGLSRDEQCHGWACRVARMFSKLSPPDERTAAYEWARRPAQWLFIKSMFRQGKTKAEVLEALAAMRAKENVGA